LPLLVPPVHKLFLLLYRIFIISGSLFYYHLCHIWLSFILAYIYKKVEKGNFVISLRSFQGGIEYSEYEGLISPAYTVLGSKVEICDDYYKSYLKSPDYIQRLNTAVYGIRDGKNISYDDFSLIYIPFPHSPNSKR